MIHPDEYNRLHTVLRGNKLGQVCATAALVMCTGSALYIGVTRRYQEVVKVLIPISLCSGVAATVSGKVANDMQKVLGDWEMVAQEQTVNRRYLEMEPTSTYELPSNSLRPFNWELFNTQRDSYPHIQIVNKSGGGKSTLAEYLVDMMGGSTIAVAPHYQVGDYPTATCIVGAGRNIGSTSVPSEYSLDDILESRYQPSVLEFIQILRRDMEKRYEIDPSTGLRRGGELVNIILDEYPSYAHEVADSILVLLREARKVGIRLIILTQSDLGSAMGLTEQDRRNLTDIYLNNDAIDHATYLYNRQPQNTPEQTQMYNMLQAVRNSDRPCLVSGQYAIIPEIVRTTEVGVQVQDGTPR